MIRILLIPITIILNILLAFSKFLVIFGSGVLGVVAFILFGLGIVAFFTMGIGEAFIIMFLGFLISPWGLPSIGTWLIARVEYFNEWLKSKT